MKLTIELIKETRIFKLCILTLANTDLTATFFVVRQRVEIFQLTLRYFLFFPTFYFSVFFLKASQQVTHIEKSSVLTGRRFTPVGESGSGRRPLPPQSLNILVGLTLKLLSLYCISVLVGNNWTVGCFINNLVA